MKGSGEDALTQSFSASKKTKKSCVSCQDGNIQLYQIVGKIYGGERQTHMLAWNVFL